MELDRLWQRAVVAQAGGRCELCSRESHCGHHIFTKASSAILRWDLANGIALCIKCHCAVHSSKTCTEYLCRIQDEVGMERWNGLRLMHRRPARYRKADLLEIRERLWKAALQYYVA
jgi:hypothetical protein